MSKAKFLTGGMVGCLLMLCSSQAFAWKLQSEWKCCGKDAKQRAFVICKNGLGPKFVNVNGKWYFRKEGGVDGAGQAHPTLDAAARAFCKE